MSSLTPFRFVKQRENAQTPKRESPKAAGLDFYSAHDVTVHSRGKEPTMKDLQIQLPEGFYGRIAPLQDWL